MSLYFDDEMIMIVGGWGVEETRRYDVVLERKRQKYVGRFRKVRLEQKDGVRVDMRWPCSVSRGNTVYFYSLVKGVGGGWFVRIEAWEHGQNRVIVKQGPCNILGIDYKTYQHGFITNNLS